MSNQVPPEREEAYPNMFPTGYSKTSDADMKYNCVAWAAEWDKEWWWESSGEPGMRWPQSVPDGVYVENYIRLFGHLGYELCANRDMEDGFEKVAIYGDGFGIFTHVARQLPDGSWSSKLGPYEDIQHNSLDAFDRSDYGTVAKLMRRRGIKSFPPCST